MEDHTPEQLAEIRDALLSLRAELVASSADENRATDTVQLDQSTQGRLSRIDAIQAQEMAKAQQRRARLRTQRIDALLRNYDDPDGEFGCCRECEEPIPLSRLQAIPDALFCVPCGERKEGR